MLIIKLKQYQVLRS